MDEVLVQNPDSGCNDNFVIPSPISKQIGIQSDGTDKIFYNEPSWKQSPHENNQKFYIEVIKEGVVVDLIRLHSTEHNKSYWSFGRFGDIRLEHPSVSRYHLILQYGELIKGKSGWFIYDLGSTHGTKLNKNAVKKHTYIPLNPGSVFQVAGSSRIFSFSGPGDEYKSPDKQIIRPETVNKCEEEDDEFDSRYYQKDPISWLQRYFEREGMSMDFHFTAPEGRQRKFKRQSDIDILEETLGSNSMWICTLELANDVLLAGGSTVTVSAPTKKLAHIHCAITACEQLEEAGLLRVSSLWNKAKAYEDNDYYEVDEDLYYDRTGQVEIQREKRKRRIVESWGKEGEKSRTYNDLMTDLSSVIEKLDAIKSETQKLTKKNEYLLDSASDVTEPNVTVMNLTTKMAISQLRSKQKKLLVEKEELEKLLLIVKPIDFDKFLPLPNLEDQPPLKVKKELEAEELSIDSEYNVISSHKPSASTSVEKPELFLPSTSETDDLIIIKPEITNFLLTKDESDPPTDNDTDERSGKIYGPAFCDFETLANEESNKLSGTNNIENEKLLGPSNLAEKQTDIIQPAKYGLLTKDDVKMEKLHRAKMEKIINKGVPTTKKSRNFDDEESMEHIQNMKQFESKDKYATWLPPEDQTGDGTTRLNKKFLGKY